MTSFNIPDIGDEITLSDDWTFMLHAEQRNKSLFDRLGETKINLYRNAYRRSVTIPKGSVLKVDRIFIRKNMSDFSSLTFFIVDSPLDELKPTNKSPNPITTFSVGKVVRFWAKLDDCNRIQFV